MEDCRDSEILSNKPILKNTANPYNCDDNDDDDDS